MDNRRFLIAILLSWAAVMAWTWMFGPDPKQPGDSPPGIESPQDFGEETASSGTPGTVGRAGAGATSGVEQGSVGPEASASLVEGSPARPEAVEAEHETSEVVETATFVAELSNRGAQIRSFYLKGHLDSEDKDLDVVRRRTGNLYPFALLNQTGPSALNEALFVTERSTDSSGATVVSFRHSSAAGSATKRFIFRSNGMFDVEIDVDGESAWGVLLGPGLRNPNIDELKRPQFTRGAVYVSGGDKEKVDARKLKEAEFLTGRVVSWVALEDTYFLTAAVPEAGVGEVELRPFLLQPAEEGEAVTFLEMPPKDELKGDLEDLSRELGVVLRSSGGVLRSAHYWGPKHFETLQALPYGLEDAARFGWLDFLARPLYLGLRWIHDNLTHNYGWAIVLMTILIRLLMLPLTHTSMSSMQKMQELNPRVTAIRAKYKPKTRDKQGRPNMEAQRKMQEEIMAIYRTAGVNPAAGCFPMLLQLPVFFSFYWLLQGALELRHAPWILWIKDLSVLDPIYVLPIVMFLTQLFQQMRMPMGGDPMQRKLFMLMPFIFLFIFLKFQAGLVLYWLTNNVVSIVQQEIYRKLRAAKENAAGGIPGGKQGSKSK